jgi:hypothetical protein
MEIVRIAADGTDPHTGPPAPSDPAEQLPLVLVTWRDAWFDFEEADDAESRSDYLVSTVGFVVREGARFLSVAQEVLPDGDGFRAVTHIPISVIESVVALHPDQQVADPPDLDRLYSPGSDATGASEVGRRDA